MRPYIEAAIARHGLQGHVRITGPITNAQVREELRQARALVMASFAEGLPVVVMEALAIGRPVLSTHITGVPELVRDGVEGWLFEAGSVEAIVGAMRACLAAPADTLARMGQAGRSRALARHHADTEAARLLALWRERQVPA
jgi:glycosyltransferase involved in cell wall biosynthesis